MNHVDSDMLDLLTLSEQRLFRERPVKSSIKIKAMQSSFKASGRGNRRRENRDGCGQMSPFPCYLNQSKKKIWLCILYFFVNQAILLSVI